MAAQLAPLAIGELCRGHLVELLDDADGYVREAATIGLQSQGDPAALEPLRAMLRRERKDRAAKGWSQTGNSSVGEVRGRPLSQFPGVR